MSIASRADFLELEDPWDVDEDAGSFVSHLYSERPNQRIIFNESFRDGSISAELSFRREGRKAEDGGEYVAWDGSILFRYQDPNNYYYAGVGGFGARYFIAKMENGQPQAVATSGRRGSMRKNANYRIELRCVGNRITLSDNGINILAVFDNTFDAGPWGLQAYGVVAEFRHVLASVVKPTCFVIMPFAPEFDDVYRVIHDTVERSYPFDCTRADERYLVGPIIEDVYDQIEKADVVIADFSGKNPNVFYEAGYAAALRKPVIQIAQSIADLPFDVRHLRTFSYTTKILGDRKLANDLVEAIRSTTGYEPIR